MSYRSWVRVAWTTHLLFAAAATWPGQTLVNEPAPFVLGLPRPMAWIAAWLVASLIVLWRMDSARNRRDRAAAERASREGSLDG